MQNTTIKQNTLKLVYTALFAAISIALNSLEISTPAFKLTFTYIPIFLAGAFIGPLAGGIAGGIGDLIGFLIHPTGAYLPVFTLASIMIGVITGVIFTHTTLKTPMKIILCYTLIFIICTVGINSTAQYYLFFAGGTKYSTFKAFLLVRLSTQLPVVAINTYISYLLYFPIKNSNLLRLKR
ncbi:MAG: folate family ECF transporter S component [Christensenellaceae bacterium]|jgi:ECF transporter S component (folate family)|nr:folate family ECF transporter S component [Christensenellaceae bacterium]